MLVNVKETIFNAVLLLLNNNKKTVYYRILLIKIPEGAALGMCEDASVGPNEDIIVGIKVGAVGS